jgi:hypothetical protein
VGGAWLEQGDETVVNRDMERSLEERAESGRDGRRLRRERGLDRWLRAEGTARSLDRLLAKPHRPLHAEDEDVGLDSDPVTDVRLVLVERRDLSMRRNLDARWSGSRSKISRPRL